jgi:hypothetical protein
MIGVILASYGVAVLAVTQDRQGNQLSLAFFGQKFGRVLDRMPTWGRPFRTNHGALAWCLWRRKGYVFPAINVVIVALIFILYSGMPVRQPATLASVLFAGCLMANIWAMPCIVGISFGSQSAKTFELDTFQATRAVGNPTLLWISFRTGLLSLLSGWALFCLGWFLFGLWLRWTGQENAPKLVEALKEMMIVTQHPKSPFVPERVELGVAGLYLCYAWMSLTLPASLMLTGRRWLIAGTCVCACLSLPVISIAGELLPNNLTVTAGRILLWGIGLGLTVGTLWAHVHALRKRMVKVHVTLLAVGLYLLLWAFMAYVHLPKVTLTSLRLCVYAGLLALPVAPLALAPIALAWNRHR